MKKTALLLLVVIFVLSTCIPLFAQKARSLGDATIRGSVAEYERIDAYSDGQGVFLRWEMKAELGNTGFLVYRTGEGAPELVSPGIIMSRNAGGTLRTLRGETYEFYDPAGTLASSYVIWNQFANGNRVASKSFRANLVRNFQAATGYTKAELEERLRSQNGILKRGDLSLPSSLQAVVNGAIQPPDPAMQRIVVTQQSVRIAVKKQGMYRVSRTELQNAGFDVNSDSANWRLFTDGVEQAILVGDGAQYIDFYGKGLDTRDTDTRIYFLIADTVPGKRMISKFLGNIGGNVISNNFRSVVETKERISYASSLRNGDLENYWGRGIISDFPACTNPSDCTLVNLTQVDPSGLNAVVTVKLQGISNGGHEVLVVLNGQEIGMIDGFSYESFSGEFTVPTSFLVEGNNVFKFATTTSTDQCLFDSIKVNYSKKYIADQNRVLFFTPGYRKMDVGGFSSPNIRVFDTTLDANPQLITGLQVTQNGGTYSVKMPSNRPAVFYGIEDSALLQSPSITPNSPSSLASPNNVADTIIISYSDPGFMAAAETWANYRRSQTGGNFAVKVVDVADIFDEFSYGAHSSVALSDFLRYARNNWQTPSPHYVLILGDASRDPRNYENRGYNDLVPTRHLELIYLESASDEALADFNNDGLAEMAIGRIPARTVSVINTVFNKTTAFEVPAMQSLDRGALFAFDLPFGYDFEAMSFVLADQLPASMPKMFVNRGLPPPNPMNQQDPMAHQNLINALNSGKYIVNYSGHGSSGSWATPAFFGINDVQFLTNANRQSIFTMLTCLNGYFNHPNFDSLGEALLHAPNGGGVATWASSTDTTPDYQLTMGAPFYREIGLGNIKRMGDLVINAKSTVVGSDVGYSWVLLGDPMLKVRQ